MAAGETKLDLVITFKHIGQIADIMTEWEGRIAEELELTQAEIAEIRHNHVGNFKQQK